MAARTINVRLPEALYNQIEELAKATSRTKSFLAVDALTNYVQSQSWQIKDIHQGIEEADAGEFATDRQVKAVFARYGGYSMPIKWTKTALRSVDEIAGFVAKDKPARTKSFVLELKAGVEKLQAYPGIGRAWVYW
jgi:RHH-type transcriptional regulator, rel operon repressor / antitoxin RelB